VIAPPAVSEPDVLDAVLADYEAEGFDVFVDPSPAVLPAFLRKHRPDAVAMRPDRKIAIEIKRSERQQNDQVDQLRELVSTHPEWELRVFYVVPRSSVDAIDIATPLAIDRAIQQVERFKNAYPPGSSLIIGWSVLEAIARSILPTQLGRAQPATRLVEVLATEGLVTPSEADALRTVAAVRNVTAHGKLDTVVEPQVTDTFIGILRTLSQLIPKAHRR
jgi:hypothetical protein